LVAAVASAVMAVLPGIAAASTTVTRYSITWHRAILQKVSASTGGFAGVSCPAANLCVAVDGAGDIVWSTNPASTSAGRWHVVPVDLTGGGLTAISCPTKTFCVAADADGRVLWTKKPTGGAGNWSVPARIDPNKFAGGGYVGIAAISCPSKTLCVAVDNAASGRVIVSTKPTAGAGTWRRGQLSAGDELTGVSCTSNSMCVLTGATTYYSTYPHASSWDWHVGETAPSNGIFDGIGCAHRTTTCVAVGTGARSTGLAAGSNAAGSKNWTSSLVEANPPLISEGLLDSVACPAKGFCLAVDSVDNVYSTHTPVLGHWGKPKALVAATTSATVNTAAISCAALTCVVADDAGDLISGVVNVPKTTPAHRKGV
jgi:hypothetical protein